MMEFGGARKKEEIIPVNEGELRKSILPCTCGREAKVMKENVRQGDGFNSFRSYSMVHCPHCNLRTASTQELARAIIAWNLRITKEGKK